MKTMFLALLLIGGGMSVTSCDENTVSQILGLLLGNTPSTYSGTATLECLQGTYNPMNYESVAKGSATLQTSVTLNTLNATGTLTIQGVKVNGTAVTPDSNKVVDIEMPERVTPADLATFVV